MTDTPKTSRPARGFREFGLLIAALALVLVGVAALRPSKPPPPASATAAPAATALVTQPQAAAPAAKPAAEAAVLAQAAPAASRPVQPDAPAAPVRTAAPPSPPQTQPASPASTPPLPAKPTTPQAVAEAPPAASQPPATVTPAGAPPRPTAQDRVQPPMKIQPVKSPGGIEAWLVEERSVPLLALRFAFDGGNAQDPAGKEGLANFVTAMLDEGAGEYDHARFQERMEELAARMSFEDGKDSFYGNFETLTANRAASLDMLRLAINKPHFTPDAVERVKKQLLASLQFAEKRPERIASKAWSAAAFPGHAYGRPSDGSMASVGSITSEDLEGYRKRVFARDTLRVVAVGDIDAAELGRVLDHVFGDLSAKADLQPVSLTTPKPTEKLQIIEMDVPQSVVQFGMNGIHRKDKDFMAGFVLNQILGGGGFASRLTEEVREKRGLAYSVYSYLQPYKHAAIFGGGVATKNEEVAQSLDVIRSELKRMADDGPTPAEVDGAKSYLTGSFALRFDTNSKIASQLLWMLQEDMGIDYVEKRNAQVDAVTIDDLKAVAKRLLTVDDLIVTVVGKPKGLAPRG